MVLMHLHKSSVTWFRAWTSGIGLSVAVVFGDGVGCCVLDIGFSVVVVLLFGSTVCSAGVSGCLVSGADFQHWLLVNQLWDFGKNQYRQVCPSFSIISWHLVRIERYKFWKYSENDQKYILIYSILFKIPKKQNLYDV